MSPEGPELTVVVSPLRGGALDRPVRGIAGTTSAATRGVVQAALLLTAAACQPGARPDAAPIPFDTTRAWVVTAADSIPLLVEVARTEAQRARGLQQRPSLEEGSGMIFLYDSVKASDEGFWMWRTLIPLDLAYLDASGEIVAVRTMQPCESPVSEWCEEEAEAYRPGVPWAGGLEVNAGWLERHQVGVGDRVVLDEELEDPPPP